MAGGARRPGRLVAALGAAAGLALTLCGCAGAGAAASADTSVAAELVGPAEPTPTSPADSVGTDGAPQDTGIASAKVAPPSTTSEPLLTTAPDDHSEVGQLVDGFPIHLLPVPSDAVILVTSAVPVGDADVQEVSLNLRTSASAVSLLELYRSALTSAGFTEVPPPAGQTDLAAEATFTRSGGDELITIGVLDVDGARTVSVGGRVHTGS